MPHFGWQNFLTLHWKQLCGKLPHGREREILKFLHRRSSLNVLARHVAQSMPGFTVDVESVWVDGTPQASFTDASGSENCELADLLLIVRKEQLLGGLVEERGLLLQAKITPKYNRLTSGSSTVLERRLFERVERGTAISLHKDTGRVSLLGNFTLGPTALGVTTGLKDCARYLLAPKWANWGSRVTGRAPYQVGWPTKLASPFLRNPKGIVEAVLDIGVTGRLGTSIDLPGTNGWSDMVAAIRGAYVGRFMNGYGHPRIQIGSAFLTVSTSFHMPIGQQNPAGYYRNALPPDEPRVNFEQLLTEPPAIPIIVVTLRGAWPEEF